MTPKYHHQNIISKCGNKKRALSKNLGPYEMISELKLNSKFFFHKDNESKT